MSIRRISVEEHLARAANARESVAKRMAAIAERRATRVSWYPRFSKWRAYIGTRTVNSKHLAYCPGTPEGEVDCARLYDSAAREAYGEFALVNFA
jgi:hypothetical protein